MAYITNGLVGANLTERLASASFDPKFPLGTVALGTDGTEWMYVKATSAIAANYCAAIDHDFNAVPITAALAAAGHTIGFAQTAFSSGDYGWIPLRGSNINVAVAASCAKNVQLYTTATAGVLDDTATSTQTLLRGVVIVTTNGTASQTSIEARITYPSGTATP